MQKVKIYGFGLVKNGVRFDYPFMESLRSLAPLVEKIYFNVGDCEDETLEKITELNRELDGKIVILEKAWPKREHGHVLSEMTNYSLGELRKQESEDNAWAIYLQSDEVLFEREYDQIKSDIEKANEQGNDAVRFRYLHFWQTHFEIAIMKRWYQQEVRAIKLQGPIESWGDAQGFRNYQNVLESDCHIYHYGHIRKESAYKDKMNEFFHLYYKGLRLRRKIFQYFIKRNNSEKTLKYFGPHPAVMEERIKKLEHKHVNTYLIKKGVNIVGEFPANFKFKILAEKINKVSTADARVRSLPTIMFQPKGLHRFIFYSKVKDKSESPLCRPWTDEFILILKLSEKGIWTK